MISNSTLEDLPAILDLYDKGIAHQKKVFHRHWQGFEQSLIEKEIYEKRQWKIMQGDVIVCIFAITHSDPLIWKEKDTVPAVYIHRIVTHPDYRGHYFVKDIITWALDFGKKHQKKFIRMDTFGDNHKLIDYYTRCGFTFLGITTLSKAPGLPSHYEGASLSLFEIAINQA